MKKSYCLIIKGVNVGMSFVRADCEHWFGKCMTPRDARIEERSYRI